MEVIQNSELFGIRKKGFYYLIYYTNTEALIHVYPATYIVQEKT
jgi:hypothetical protein